jgi:hypothetical protein
VAAKVEDLANLALENAKPLALSMIQVSAWQASSNLDGLVLYSLESVSMR